MSDQELRAQARRSAPYIKIAGVLWLVAFMTVMIAAVAWVVLAVMTGDYFTHSKAVRDAAEAGTGLLSQQGSIEAVENWVLPFAFVGLATFLLGSGGARWPRSCRPSSSARPAGKSERYSAAKFKLRRN